jgi:dihydropteroate synthase
MTDDSHIRPTGFVYGSAAAGAVDEYAAGWLAGGPVAFSAVEVIEGAPGKARRRFAPWADMASSKDELIGEWLQRLTAPRPDFPGLSLDRPRVMGVVNVTPDSFSDGGLYDTTEAAVAHGATLVKEGATILDVGGESTRPGADPVEARAEEERILPVIEELRGAKAVISADSRKSAVMRKAAESGAGMLNDVSALTHDEDSVAVAAETGLPVVLMHAQGDPRTMQDNPVYDDVVLEVFDFLAGRIAACEAAGIPRARLVADPGIGFGKTLEHNLALLGSLSLFHGLGVALLVGSSRKRFIGTLTGEDDPQRRVSGSIAAVLAAAAQGVQLHRVHDVAETVRALTVWRAAIKGDAGGLV